MLHPGATVDRYVIEYLLGKGGMAEVWAVRHAVLGTRRALKVLSLRRPGLVERLVEEGRVQARLEHANVVPVLDVVEVEGCPALVMPLVVGMALDDALARLRLSVPEVAAVMTGLVRGVAHAHRLGVAHRDIKPANVLLALQGEELVPRVSDFGLAKALDPGLEGPTRAGAVMGTPPYAAPEQLMDASSADHRADWWAVGVTLYELLTGRRPFDAQAIGELVTLQRERSYPPLEEAMPGLDPGWAALVSDLLQPDLSARSTHGPEVLSRLQALGADRGPVLTEGALVDVVRAAVAAREAQREAEVVRSATPSGPPSEAPARPRYHLPAERDAFMGRQADLAEVERRLEAGARLLTVLGPAGTGKTRLVVHHGWSALRRWPGGVWFCDLSDARTLDGMAYAVGRALGVPLGRTPVEQLGHALAGRGQCLVILDNFEQVAEHAEATLGHWLDRTELARFVVTSRQVLGSRGEEVVALGPLDSPSAVRLFTLRAQSASHGFTLTEAGRSAVETLVRLLDGLPLAIELAAARVPVLSPEQILARMEDRFRLLARRGARDRQATLRGAIDGSWELLTEAERAGLAQLSAFEGGFTLASAEAVLDLSPMPDAPWPVDLIQSLVRKSLVRPVGEDRFDLLVSIQAYAAEKLGEPGACAGSGPEAVQGTWSRHGAHFGSRGVQGVIDGLHSHGGPELRKRFIAELDNLVSACRRAVARGDGPLAAALLGATWEVHGMLGPLDTGVELATEVLAMPRLDGADRARAVFLAARACWVAGRVGDTRTHCESALSGSRALGDRRLEARILGLLAVVQLFSGDEEAAGENAATALASARELGDRICEIRALNVLGILGSVQGRDEEALRRYTEALALARDTGDLLTASVILANLGEYFLNASEYATASEHLEAGLVAARGAGSQRTEGIALGTLGTLRHREGRPDEARQRLGEGERLVREVGDLLQLGMLLTRRGEVEHGEGERGAAAACLAEAEAIARRLDCAAESELGQRIAGLRALLAGER